MDSSYRWNLLSALGLGFLLSLILLAGSLIHEDQSLSVTSSERLTRTLLQLLGPPTFMLVMTFIRNRTVIRNNQWHKY